MQKDLLLLNLALKFNLKHWLLEIPFTYRHMWLACSLCLATHDCTCYLLILISSFVINFFTFLLFLRFFRHIISHPQQPSHAIKYWRIQTYKVLVAVANETLIWALYLWIAVSCGMSGGMQESVLCGTEVNSIICRSDFKN